MEDMLKKKVLTVCKKIYQLCQYYIYIVSCIECFYVNDEPESKFLHIETIKLYCIVYAWENTVSGVIKLVPQEG